MYKIIACWIFIARLFACSYCYVASFYTNTDDGYCEYFNGLLIPVNDYAFDVEKCERIDCYPGQIRIGGCVPVILLTPPGQSCRLVRGEGIMDCCPTIRKCKVISRHPGIHSYPKNWIIEDDGNYTLPSLKEDSTEKDEYEEDRSEEVEYEEDRSEEDEYEDNTNEEAEYEGDRSEEDEYEENTTEEDEYEEDTTEEDTTKEVITEKTIDPLLSEINRYARNYPIK